MEGAQCPRGSSTGTQSTHGKPQLSVVCGCSSLAQALAAPPGPAPITTALPAPPAAAGCAVVSGGWDGVTHRPGTCQAPRAEGAGTHTPKTRRDPRQPIPRGTQKGSGVNPRRPPAADSARDGAFHLTYIWWELWEGKGICGVVGKE